MSNYQQTSTVRTSPPSFIDLRQFAKDQTQGNPLPGSSESGDDRFLSSRRILDLPLGPVTIGAIALEAGSGTVTSQPMDEFVIVCDGTLTLTQQDRTLVLGPGNSAVLQHGADFTWAAERPVSLVFMRYHGSKPGDRMLVPITETPPLEPSGPPSAELLISPTPTCRSYTDYRSADGEFLCGTWDSTPYHRRAMSYRHYELMHLLEGSVTFEDEIGRRATFSRGDIFVVEQYAQCSWESQDHVAKVYAIYHPA